MARHKEPLNGGLVTVKSPSILNPGELTFVRNAVYLPGSEALWRSRGRSAFGTATASAISVDGLRDAKFDNGNHYLIAHASASYLTAAVGDTGTFGVLVTGVGDGSQLEIVHYRNRFILFNGAAANVDQLSTNKVIYQSATAVATTPTVRQHGMFPMESEPSTTAITGEFSQTVTGYYEYWTTEVAKFFQDGVENSIEGTFSGNPATVFVSSTGMAPVIHQPTTVNAGFATHWRVYRSPKKDKQSDKKFPTGFMIAEAAISSAITGIADSFTVSSASALPTQVNLTASGHVYADFTNATALTAAGGGAGGFASATATIGQFGSLKQQGAYSFNLGGFVGNVRGIKVEVTAYCDVAPTPIQVRIGKNRNAVNGSFIPPLSNGIPAYIRNQIGEAILQRDTSVKSGIVSGTASATPQVLTFGGESDRWWPPDKQGLVDSDFAGGNYMVVVSMLPYSGTRSIAVDAIKTTVYYAATFDSVIPFPTVVYTFGDISAQVGKNGPPPNSSTGDLYEDALVVNDVTNPGIIKYSYPGNPEAFPSTYYLDFETRENDRVTNIKTINGRLLVFLDSATFRANYLPSERDASFDRGKAIETISTKYGCVNEMCACTYTPAGGPERLAWVSDSGIHTTDAFSFDTMTEQLDWGGDRSAANGIAPTGNNYTPISLINDPDRENLVFTFRNDAPGHNGPYFGLHIHYNDLGQDGKPKISGFTTLRNSISGNTADPTSMWPVKRSTGVTDIYIGYGGSTTAAGAGQVYRENGTDIPQTTPFMRYMTRRMFLSDFGNEWKFDALYGHNSIVSFSGTPIITYTAANTKTNNTSTPTFSKTYTFSSGQTEQLHRVPFNLMVEGMQLSVTASGQGSYCQEFLLIDGEGFGNEDSGL